MSSQNKYLAAAAQVLARVGRPMHYESIADVAMKLGILKTNCRTPWIMMGTLLNKDIAQNPQTAFLKKKPGVFALKSRNDENKSPVVIRLHSSSAKYLDDLRTELGLVDSVGLLRKATYLFRRVSDHLMEEERVSLVGPLLELTIENLDADTLTQLAAKVGAAVLQDIFQADDQTHITQRYLEIFLPIELGRAMQGLSEREGYDSIVQISNASISLLKIASVVIYPERALRIEGPKRRIQVQIVDRAHRP